MKPMPRLALALLLVPMACRASPDRGPDPRRMWELEDENARLRERVAELEGALRESPADLGFGTICPPAIETVVLSWNGVLVVLDKGEQDGVRIGFVFDVYKGTTYKGQVRVQEVQPETCSCSVLSGKQAIAVGDSATTCL